MYEFTNDCLLNIDTIDDEHRRLFEIMRLLSEFREYTQVHAAFIERLVGINLSKPDDMDDNQQEYLLDLIQFL